MSAAGWKVEIGRAVLDASSPEAVAAIEAENARNSLPGLPDELNPRMIDTAKWRALVGALSPGAAEVLGGRPLFLDPVGLRIAASSPTKPASFGPSTRLTAGDTVGDAIMARSDAPYDCDLARARAQAARKQTQGADQQVKALESRQEAAAMERQVRYAAALAWRENATAAAGCQPGDPQAAAEQRAAEQAASDFILLGGSMQ